MLRIVSAGLLIIALAIPSSAIQQKWVGVLGCSNSRDIELAYKNVSSRDVTWNAAAAGATLSAWARGNWRYFDIQAAAKPVTAVWYPLCIKNGEYPNFDAAWVDFLRFLVKLRQRTQAPLYLTPFLGTQTSCTLDTPILQLAITEQAAALGYAQRSLPDIPPASNPKSDGCHFDPVKSTNVGQAAADFLDN